MTIEDSFKNPVVKVAGFALVALAAVVFLSCPVHAIDLSNCGADTIGYFGEDNTEMCCYTSGQLTSCQNGNAYACQVGCAGLTNNICLGDTASYHDYIEYLYWVSPSGSIHSWPLWSWSFDEVGTWKVCTLTACTEYTVADCGNSVTPTPTPPVVTTVTPVPTTTEDGGGNGGSGGTVPVVPVVTAGQISTISTLSPNLSKVVDKDAYRSYLENSTLSVIISPYLALWDSVGTTIQNFFVTVENVLLTPFSYIASNMATITGYISEAVTSLAACVKYYVVIITTAINSLPDIWKAVITLALGVDACLLLLKGRFGNA